MSLVNDVLRQLDNRQQTPEQLMPLQSLRLDNNAKNTISIQNILVCIGLLLIAILLLQLFYQQPLSKLIFSESIPEIVPQILPLGLVVSAEVGSVGSTSNFDVLDGIVDKDVRVEDVLLEKVLVAELQTEEALPASIVGIKSSENIGVMPTKVVRVNTVANTTDQQPIESEAKIRIVEVAGLKQYQLALKAYKKKQSAIAMTWINQAIEKNSDEKFLILKARIFMQQGDSNGLQGFVLNQSENGSLAWFQHVAPGLQMFGFYKLSNQYYSQLITRQPKQIKWRLAMALNYSRLGLESKSYAIYQALSGSSLLSRQQKQWIDSQLNRIKSDKVVMNGS